MNNKTYLIAAMCLIIGAAAGMGITRASMNDSGKQVMSMDHSSPQANHTMSSGMDAAASNLKGKQGLDFDEAFISDMIVHHQGAVAMATLASANAQHQEIKDLAKAIVSAQTTEINQMRQWQKDWFGK